MCLSTALWVKKTQKTESTHWNKRENINHVELCSFPNLVLNGGEENLQEEGGGSLSRQKLCEIPVAKNGGKRGEAGGKSQEKVQVTLFFFLETNSGWTQGDARQFTKSQALLSRFSKPCNLETGPQPTIASSSQTAVFNLCKSSKKKKKKIPKCLLLTHTDKMSVKTVHVEFRKMVLPPRQTSVYFHPSWLWMQQRQTKWQGSLTYVKGSFEVVFTDKVIVDILFHFLPLTQHSATSLREYSQAFVTWAALLLICC